MGACTIVQPAARAFFTVSTVFWSMLFLFHDALHGIVQRAALRREVVLVLNKDYRRSLGIHIFLLSCISAWTAVDNITTRQ